VDNLRHHPSSWNKFNLYAKPLWTKEFFPIAAQREPSDDASEQQAAVKDLQQKLGDRRGHG
jgi:hypothetical protein